MMRTLCAAILVISAAVAFVPPSAAAGSCGGSYGWFGARMWGYGETQTFTAGSSGGETLFLDATFAAEIMIQDWDTCEFESSCSGTTYTYVCTVYAQKTIYVRNIGSIAGNHPGVAVMWNQYCSAPQNLYC